MKLTEEQIKRHFQEHTTRAGDQKRECLSTEELSLAVEGKISSEFREKLVEHLGSCSNCAAEIQTLFSVKGWANAEAATSGKNSSVRPARTRSLPGWLKGLASPRWAVATGLVLISAVSISVWYLQTISHREGDIQNKRGGSYIAIEASPNNLAQLKSPPERLSWRSQVVSPVYQVAIYDFESTLIWKSGPIKEASIDIPPDVRAKMEPGRKYYWRVFFVDGLSRKSRLLQFELAPNDDH